MMDLSTYHAIRGFMSQKFPGATLLAVSKTKPGSDILELRAAGHLQFGENYIQELVDKAKELPSDIEWHFIGNLQSNKIKALVDIPNLHAIHTIDSIKKADLANKHRKEQLAPLKVYIQVNTSQEESKGGIETLDQILEVSKHIVAECPRLCFEGLMTIGKYDWKPTASETENPDFVKLRSFKDQVQVAVGRDNLGLSMGMSGDYEHALAMGSTCVRIGSLLFGARDYSNKN